MPHYAPNSRAQLVSQLMANNTHGLLAYDRTQFSTMYPKQPDPYLSQQQQQQNKGGLSITL